MCLIFVVSWGLKSKKIKKYDTYLQNVIRNTMISSNVIYIRNVIYTHVSTVVLNIKYTYLITNSSIMIVHKRNAY